MTTIVHRAYHILQDFGDEMRAQVTKWGYQSHPDGTGPNVHSLAEFWTYSSNSEVAEMAKRRTDEAAKTGTVTWEHILTEEIFEAYAEEDPVKLRAELVQAGAVIGSWIRDIDSKASEVAA